MDEQILQQIFDELVSSLEPLDTHSAALLQFLKSKGIVPDEELAPFLEQAANASSVRWLGTRVRIDSLISAAMRPKENQPPDSGTGEKSNSSKAASSNEDELDKQNSGAEQTTHESNNETSTKEAA